MQRAVRGESRIRQQRSVDGLRRWYDRLGENLSFPAQAVVQREVWSNLPTILHEQREVFVLDGRFTWRRSTRNSRRDTILQIQQQWSTYATSRWARLIERSALRDPSGEGAGAVKTLTYVSSKTIC